MSVLGINNYNSPNYYDANTNRTSKKEDVTKSSKAETNESSVKNAATQKYLEDLQKRHSQLNIMGGNSDTSRTSSANSKTDVIIDPSILNQMASNPEAAMKYEKMISALPALDKWANSMIRSLTGNNVKYRQVWIDKDGNMGSFSISEPSEETKKAQQQKQDDKKLKEQREKQNEFIERLKKRNKNPEETAYLDSIKKLISLDYKV